MTTKKQAARPVAMSGKSPTTGNAKVMNRYDLICRLTAKLTHGEAVIGGIGYCSQCVGCG